MSDTGITSVQYLAMLGGVTFAQMEETITSVCESLRNAAFVSAEFAPGLTIVDRQWVRDMTDAQYDTPTKFAEKWLSRA